MVRQLYKEGGIRSIYKGTVATLMRGTLIICILCFLIRCRFYVISSYIYNKRHPLKAAHFCSAVAYGPQELYKQLLADQECKWCINRVAKISKVKVRTPNLPGELELSQMGFSHRKVFIILSRKTSL